MNPWTASVALYGRLNGLTYAECDQLWDAMAQCPPSSSPSQFLRDADSFIQTIRTRQENP